MAGGSGGGAERTFDGTRAIPLLDRIDHLLRVAPGFRAGLHRVGRLFALVEHFLDGLGFLLLLGIVLVEEAVDRLAGPSNRLPDRLGDRARPL